VGFEEVWLNKPRPAQGLAFQGGGFSVVWINYPHRVVYVRFIGTHEQYDKIDAQTI